MVKHGEIKIMSTPSNQMVAINIGEGFIAVKPQQMMDLHVAISKWFEEGEVQNE